VREVTRGVGDEILSIRVGDARRAVSAGGLDGANALDTRDVELHRAVARAAPSQIIDVPSAICNTAMLVHRARSAVQSAVISAV